MKAAKVAKKKKTKPTSPVPSSAKRRRLVIKVRQDKIPRMGARAILALGRDQNLYQRAHVLVTVAQEPERIDYEQDQIEGRKLATRPGTPTIRPVDFPCLVERLARCAAWKRYDARAGRNMSPWVPTNPDRSTVAFVLSTPEREGIRPIDMIAEAPFLRADGAIVRKSGYDRRSACVLLPSCDFPEIPNEPTQDDAIAAMVQLVGILRHFPFRAGPDRYVPISAILTMLARQAILGPVPLHFFDATTPGSGKSLLADFVAMVVTGRPAPLMSWPENPEELEKVLAAYALQGARLITFDNVSSPLCGAPLDKVLTQSEANVRILGRSEIPNLPWRALILATGNNLTVRGDTERRVLGARLEPDCERPEDREGLPDLLRWVRRARALVVMQALTVLRAYVVAGKPGLGLRPWGRFESWAELIPGAIVYAGGENVLDARPTARGEGDPDRAALACILEAWGRLDSGRGLPLRGLLSRLYNTDGAPDGFDDAREAIEFLAPGSGKNPVDPHRLGQALKRLRGRWIEGRRLVGEADKSGVTRWRVERRDG